jgi:hypothetical protein
LYPYLSKPYVCYWRNYQSNKINSSPIKSEQKGKRLKNVAFYIHKQNVLQIFMQCVLPRGYYMQPLTKQELQGAMQQLRDSVLGQVATKQDINNATNVISQRLFNQGDMQRALDASRDRFMDKLGQPFRQQQTSMQQMMNQLDAINRRLAAIEKRMGIMHGSINSVRSDAVAVAQRGEVPKKTMLSQMFT